MHTDKNEYFDSMEEENSIQLKQMMNKYLRYWPWFLITILIALFTVFAYLRYADVIYRSEAKVKLLLDKESSNFTLDVTKLFNKSNINLENEIALFKSVHLSEQVVKNLKLNVEYYYNSTVKSKQIFNAPFVVSYNDNITKLKDAIQYTIKVNPTGYTILDVLSGQKFDIKGYTSTKKIPNLPINIKPALGAIITKSIDLSYNVVLKPLNKTALELSNAFEVDAEGKDSDILSISLEGTNGPQSEAIINNLIHVFEADGITDKQEVSRRTINFVDDRFVYLRKELDSIESSKKEYKRSNNLSFIQEDAGSSIVQKTAKEQASFDIESQLLLADLLKKSIESQKAFELLPADIGIQNPTINQLVADYNTAVLSYQKLQTSAGSNNPSIQLLVSTLVSLKNNIINSVKGFRQQLKTTLVQSESAQKAADGSFASIPEKEKVLRSIERQQNLKESLYLLLLQKREEASINLAVTVANTKIIDYAITDIYPVSPQRSKIVLIALFLGMVIPFTILFIIFKLDNKIYTATDVENIAGNVPILVELPSLKEDKDSYIQNLEAFRTLAHNTNFITPYTEDQKGKVIFVTSSIKGEGKTFVSYNLATAYSHLDKKVIVIGADFRNPQLHRHLDNVSKDTKGFSNYLHDGTLQWRDLLHSNDDKEFPFDLFLSGIIPPNPTLLLSNQRFEKFINEVKEEYDIIIFDTPPTLLVSDTLMISKYADTSLFVLRSAVTEKNLISYSKKLFKDKKIINMGYVLNDIDFTSSYGYGYNYGYGYGYGKEVVKKSWFQKWKRNK
ncbi:polysaccharide biosynthesis tyrosine autokinase [Flavobacterium sp. AC]|uniref:non-specific protein-tyrosine kinase n=1 Tax=Flavobacterium azizsancarii TaxID=2961580 RepID=A0ABT4WGC1_9FLAO|nr:tyrosine-protein kinase family protein [Flavobacterium azizsancarii]MDA6071516.1 polysaccharide biosynthesis tyrosine autokinase [Flavobacterium azizsancarii]